MRHKVLYISYDGMTDQLGQSQVLPYLFKLSGMGYDFTLLSFEKKDKYKKFADLIAAQCSQHGIRWVPEFFSSRPPVLSKMYDSWKMKRSAIKLHRRYGFDFTHCRSYVAADAALKLFRKFRLPFLFDMRGFWVDERVDFGQWNMKNPLMRLAYKIYKKKEQHYLKNSAHIISLTEKGKLELENNYDVAGRKISVIPCCADFDHFDYKNITEKRKKETRSLLGLKPDDVVVSYLGSLGGMYLTDEMLDFFKTYKENEPRAKFLVISFSRKEEIVVKAAQRGIDPADIIVHGSPRENVPLLLSLSTVSLSFIMDKYSKKASSPTKQGEIMAMGIPAICNDIGDIGMIMNDTNAGVLLKGFNGEAYKTAIDELKRLLPADREAIRNSALRYYDLSTGAIAYDRAYKEVIG